MADYRVGSLPTQHGMTSGTAAGLFLQNVLSRPCSPCVNYELNSFRVKVQTCTNAAGDSVGGGSSAADTDADLEAQHRSVDGSEAAAVLGWSTEVSVTRGAAGPLHAPLSNCRSNALYSDSPACQGAELAVAQAHAVYRRL